MRTTLATTVAACLVLGCGSKTAPSATDQTVPTTTDPGAPAPAQPSGTGAPAETPAATPIADQYRDAGKRILAAALADKGGWEKLAYITDRVGHRLSGSAALDQAITWSADIMKKDGHAVSTEKVMVPNWKRGAESGRILAPVSRPLRLIALGGSGSTGKRKLIAPVVVVRTFKELDALGAKVAGKIVLFNHPMPAYSEESGPGYGQTVPYRTSGPSKAAAYGAKAALVRSVTAHSLQTPHTGYTGFAKDIKPIPAAAVSVEDAELLSRLAASGDEVRVELELISEWKKDAPSANVIAEIVGTEKPEEVVVIGAHIDSWDVGQGAHDDGAGCATVMQALTIIRSLGLKPRRTIRVVLFTNEENGLRGAVTYAANQGDKVKQHVMALEADTGGFAPRGFRVMGDAKALANMKDIVSLLAPIDANRAVPGFAGADVGPLMRGGTPGLGLWMDTSKYFDYHHSEADTLDKVNPEDLRKDIAAVALVAFVIADLPERFGAGPTAEQLEGE